MKTSYAKYLKIEQKIDLIIIFGLLICATTTQEDIKVNCLKFYLFKIFSTINLNLTMLN